MFEIKENTLIAFRDPNENDYHESYKIGEVWYHKDEKKFFVLTDIINNKSIWSQANQPERSKREDIGYDCPDNSICARHMQYPWCKKHTYPK